MKSILIQSKSSNNLKLLTELAKKIGDRVNVLSKEQVEDIAFGSLMKKSRTGKNASMESVMKKLQSIK